MAIDLIANLDKKITATRWRSLKLYNAYRLLIALLLLATQDLLNNVNWLQNAKADLFSTLVLGYFAFSIISAIFTWY